MIYVMGTSPSGVVKIGTALNPLQRLKQIQAGHPEPLEVLLAAPGDRATADGSLALVNLVGIPLSIEGAA